METRCRGDVRRSNLRLDLLYSQFFLDPDSSLYFYGAAIEKAARVYLIRRLTLSTRNITHKQMSRWVRRLSAAYVLALPGMNADAMLRAADDEAGVILRNRACRAVCAAS